MTNNESVEERFKNQFLRGEEGLFLRPVDVDIRADVALRWLLNETATARQIGRAEERKEILERLNDKRFTQMDIAMNADLTFLKYTPTEIYNKALKDVTDIINQLN